MRAAVTETFGGVDRVVVREVPKPVPGPGEVLVRVRAASMNPLDCKLREGRFRLIFRVKAPFVLGFDLAGEVEAVGPGVTRLRAGDAVFGEMPGPGSHAEYAVVGEEHLLPRPARLSFEEAAALPAAGMSALQVLRDEARVRAGQRVAINGAGGGIGTFALQIAKAWGARVTAVASARNQELLRELGADECLDYSREDFARREAAFDVILDVVPNRSFPECRRALAAGGTYLRMQSGHARGKIVVRP